MLYVGQERRLAHGAGDFAVRLALGDGLALVVVGLALRDADQDLGVAVLEVQLEGDEGHALELAGLLELADLPAMGEEAACTRPRECCSAPAGPYVLDGGLVHDQLRRLTLDAAEPLPDGDVALPHALDLAAVEGDAALEGVEDVVVEPRLAVLDRAVVVEDVSFLFFAISSQAS
jgi:hypothetical protein